MNLSGNQVGRDSGAGGQPLSGIVAKSVSVCLAVTMALASLGWSAPPVQAQDAIYDGGKARVKLAARLRSLSEEVASSSCRLTAGIDPEVARADLEIASSRFFTILSGLQNGDNALGIPSAETSGAVTSDIQAAAEAWSPIAAETTKMLGGASDADLSVISDNFKALLERSIELTSRMSGEYSNPQELLQSDAIALDFMERQGMFLSRMGRVMCALASGTGSMGTVDELREAVDLFDLSLVALRDGFPTAGINPPRNDAVRGSLSATYDIWAAQRGILDAAIAGGAVDPATVAEVVTLTKELSVAMNNTITLHMISSPGQEGVFRVPLIAYANDELARWIEDPDLIAAVKAQNTQNAGLVQADIDQLDLEWRAEAKAGGGPLISDLMGRPVSLWLQDKQGATAGFVTEVFVMDNKGLNVAQSEVTSDYWQGDEAKWQETFGNGSGDIHISEVEFDDSTGFYQTQASLAIRDPATGELIGAITFGINIQNLM